MTNCGSEFLRTSFLHFSSLLFLPQISSALHPTILASPLRHKSRSWPMFRGVPQPHSHSFFFALCQLLGPCLTWFFQRTIQFSGIRPFAGSDSFRWSDSAGLGPLLIDLNFPPTASIVCPTGRWNVPLEKQEKLVIVCFKTKKRFNFISYFMFLIRQVKTGRRKVTFL